MLSDLDDAQQVFVRAFSMANRISYEDTAPFTQREDIHVLMWLHKQVDAIAWPDRQTLIQAISKCNMPTKDKVLSYLRLS
jgi:hypothetical protein